MALLGAKHLVFLRKRFSKLWQGSISGYYLDQQAGRAHLQEIHGEGIDTLSGNEI